MPTIQTRVSASTVSWEARLGAMALQPYHEDLLRQVRRRMGWRLRRLYEPQDVLQEAFAAALQSPPADRPRSLRSWFLGVIDHRLHALGRRERPRRRPRIGTALPAALVTFDSVEIANVASGPGNALDSDPGDLAVSVLLALGRLPFDARACFFLREVVAMPWPLVASSLGLSVGAARGLHERTRRTLRLKPAFGGKRGASTAGGGARTLS